MAGYNLIRQIKDLEEKCDSIGLVITYSRHGSYDHDVVAVKAKDSESLPFFSRDAELFVGSLEQLNCWLNGIFWARDYDTMAFGRKHDDNRAKKEQVYRHKQLVRILKGE